MMATLIQWLHVYQFNGQAINFSFKIFLGVTIVWRSAVLFERIYICSKECCSDVLNSEFINIVDI